MLREPRLAGEFFGFLQAGYNSVSIIGFTIGAVAADFQFFLLVHQQNYFHIPGHKRYQGMGTKTSLAGKSNVYAG